MQRFFSLFLSYGLHFAVCACSREKNLTELEEIQQQLAEMEGYACTATLIRRTESGEKTYETKQYYKSTGEYRLELTAPETVAGNYTVFDGDRICQYNPRVNDCIIRDVPESQHRSELFLGQFIKNYMQSEGVSVETASFDSSKCVVLWIDRESLLPVRFVIYDADDKERYRMDYHEFTFHPQFDADTFRITE